MSKSKTDNFRAKSEPVENFFQAVDALKRGEIIVFPTETLYGLGADALNDAAVEKVFLLKARDPAMPIPVLVASQAMLFTLVAAIPVAAKKLMDRFWPGPLTLVLRAREGVPSPLLNNQGGVGVRISSQPLAMQLVKALGHPLIATSANPSGQEPARTIAEAKRYFETQVRIFLDGGTLTSRTGSTVVEVIEDQVKIIREGDISASELRRVLGEVKLS